MVNKRTRRRLRWAAILSLCALSLVVCLGMRFWHRRHVSQSQLLQQVIQIESTGVDEHTVQPLGWMLAILGRDDELRHLDFHPQFEFPPLDVDTGKLELNAVPWREGLEQIAAEHRIVMIMEDHFVSKHREMIGATLPTFRDAGFTHYAAEAIGESASSLRSRGYPSIKTGYYTSDPQFGNVLRQALELEFQVLGYDFRPITHDWREEYAATQLAELLRRDPETRLLVHAGLAHVLKHETELGQRWLASILWEMTEIEPFTIWQWSSMRDGYEHRVVADALRELGDFSEPILLMPPPGLESGLRNVPRVDAILVHPPDQSVAPGDRTVLFPSEMQSVSGQWLTPKWPVVIAAFKRDEPATAIPLDQVMMRDGERDFLLWIPASARFDLAVFDQHGLLVSTITTDRDLVTVRAE